MATFPGGEQRNVLAPDCRRCPALVDDRECISWGNGPLDADLLVVGEAPGAGDPAADRWQGGNRTGMAYTSRHSGRRIRDLLADAGFGPEACYFTNAVKCFPSDGKGSNREPTDEELENCRPYLREEIETIDPAAIVPTGKHATLSILALDGDGIEGSEWSFLDSVLEPVEREGFDASVVPLLHSSYQDVWIGRLGYDAAGYRDAVARVLGEVT